MNNNMLELSFTRFYSYGRGKTIYNSDKLQHLLFCHVDINDNVTNPVLVPYSRVAKINTYNSGTLYSYNCLYSPQSFGSAIHVSEHIYIATKYMNDYIYMFDDRYEGLVFQFDISEFTNLVVV